jgi:hypothetical protein
MYATYPIAIFGFDKQIAFVGKEVRGYQGQLRVNVMFRKEPVRAFLEDCLDSI